jgi:hypothetical protein
MTGEQAADIIVRLDAGWPDRWDATKVDLWLEMLQELDFDDTFEAVTELFRISEKLPTFATLRTRVEMADRRRHPGLPASPCLRCKHQPAEVGRTRCAPCQLIVDDEVARGVVSPAMAGAIAAAHRSRLAKTEVVE